MVRNANAFHMSIGIQIDVYIIDHTHIIHAFCQLALRLMPKLKLYFEIYNRIMSRSPRKRRKLHNGEKVECLTKTLPS